ncbi:E3 ubiquitin-protein ligase ubr1 [Rhodotorula kratochvilovae]
MSRPQAPPPPFPDPRTALSLNAPADLAAYIDQLAAPALYSLAHPSARARLKLALYSYALDPDSPFHPLFLPNDADADAASVSDDWSLATAQHSTDTAHAHDDEYGPSRRGKPCAHVFRQGESVYRCRDCGTDPTCVLCARCFHASSHARDGHDVTVSTHAGVGAGCCDCGDAEAWKPGRQRDCRYHGLDAPAPAASGKGKERATEADERADAAKERVATVLALAMDWALDVLERCPEVLRTPTRLEEITGVPWSSSAPERPNGPGPDRFSVASAEPEADADDAVATTPRPTLASLAALLRAGGGADADAEAVLAGLAEADGTTVVLPAAEGEADADEEQDGLPPPGRLLEQIMRQMQQTPGVTGVVVDRDGNPVAVQTAADDLDEEHTPAVLLPGSFPSSSASAPAPPAPPLPPPTTPPYAVVLWNDEQHSFREVIDQVALAVGCSPSAASGVATRVDTLGRDVILVTPSAAEALRVARVVAQIKLVVSVREARETFREQCAAEVLLSARDLLRARLGAEGPGALADVVARVLLERGGDGRSRFMRWAEVEARMWKAPRKTGQEIAVALMGVGGEVKTELSVQYAEIYSSLATTYLLTDREPEHSLIFFGVQVFTVPSVAALLVSRHYFLSRLLKVLTSFLTGQLSPDRTRLVLPPNPSRRTLNLDSPLIAKQRRYFQLFSDLTHLIQCAPVQRLIASAPHLLDDMSAFAALFEGMNPLARAAGAHVEYESEQWSTAFNLTIQLARVCRAFGAAFHPLPSSSEEAGDAGAPSTLDLARALNTLLVRLAGSAAPRATHDVVLAGRSYGPLVRYSVAREPVSYHHPLAWLWAEMAKGLAGERGSEVALRQVGVEGVKALLGGEGAEGELKGMVRAMEEPLRVLALVAQVRSGVWVRNGFTVRAQNLHYRDYSLRETTFEQDLFFLQTALVVLDPSLVVAALVDRFEVRDWLVRRARPAGEESPYEPEQALAMIDELLNLLITLVSDPTSVVPLSPTAALRRELVHYLALGPCVYSDLLRRVSERFSDDPNIDRLLAEVATFKPPSGANDQGTYALREELLAEVDPYFARYTRNQREEADAAVRAWMKKRGEGDVPVLLPRRLPIQEGGASGPFERLPHALGADALLAVVFYALRAGCGLLPAPRAADAEADAPLPAPLFSEAVVDQALQLALLAHVEAPDALAAFAVRAVVLEDSDGEGASESLAQVLVRVEEDERLKGVAHKARFVLDWLIGVHGAAVADLRRKVEVEEEEGKASDAKHAAEAKRRAAKARQEAIMRQFQQAQSAFLQSVDDDEDDDAAEEDAMHPADDEIKKVRVEFGDCIVCQDALEDTQPFGILALVQGSNLIRLTPGGATDAEDDEYAARPRRRDRTAYQREVLDLPPSLDRDMSHLRPYGVAGHKLPLPGFADSGDGLAEGFPQTTKDGIAATSCGHMMHLACFERYCRSLEQRHHSQPTRCHPENLERREFVCPLCKSLGNVLLPAEVDSAAFVPFAGQLDQRSLAEWGKPDADPLEEGTLARFDATFHNRVDKLSLLSEHGEGGAFKPWRATMALPMLLPAHFNDAEGRMVARLLQVVTALQSEIGGPGSGVATLSGDVVGYTVSALEIASRGTAEPAWALSEASVRLLQSLVAAMQDLAELMTQSVESARIAAVSVRQRLGGVFAQGTKFADMPFTQVDPLGAVIEAAVCMPSAFYHVVAVAFYTALAQNLLRVYRLLHCAPGARALWEGAKGDECVEAECSDLSRIRDVFAMAPALFGKDEAAFVPTLGKLLHAQMVVFLRRVSIVARVAFGAPSDEATDAFMDDDERSEYARLLELLRIPPPSEVFRASDHAPTDPSVVTLRAHLSACRDSVNETLFGTPDPHEAASALLHDDSVGELEHPVPYELLGLPHQLDTLAAAALEMPCQRCGDVPRDPAICLLCGEILCAQSFCCMVGEKDAMHGECNEHMWTCGGSVGVYYLVKSNVILYLHADKGSFSTPPYLDSHGEVDVGGRRGRSQFPQYLHRGRYDEVRRLWLSHGIPTFVARKLEATNNPGGWHAF